MNKNINKNAKQAQQNASFLTEIGEYNKNVREYLSKNTVSEQILLHTIKNFKDNAKRNVFSDLKYNKEVEIFNNNHGFYLLKKGSEYCSKPKYYSYINYPFLSKEDKSQSIINFKKHKEEYNKKVTSQNAKNAIYNIEIVKANSDLTNEEKNLKKQFTEDYKHLNVWEFNQLVEESNEGNPIHKKKKIQKLRQQHVVTFRTLLYFYIGQLKRRNYELLSKNKSTSVKKTNLPPLQVNKNNLKKHKIDGYQELDYCTKTLYNHIDRLLEAGVFNTYRFYWSKMPITLQFNREIIQISDYNLPKSQNTEKQMFNIVSEKNLPNYTQYTRTVDKEVEIKDCVSKHSSNKCGSMPDQQKRRATLCPADGYRTTQRISKKKLKLEGGEKIEIPDFSKPKNTRRSKLAYHFKSKKITKSEFCEKLASNEFKDYKPLRYDYLEKVRLNTIGEVSKEDFKEILIQDFIKTSAKIWKNHTVYVNEWYNTIEYLSNVLFANLFEKESIENKLREYRWKLEWARKWFTKNEFKALFPNNYFDTTRKNKNEIGFFSNHLHNKWKESLSKSKKQKINRVTEASKRQKRLRKTKYEKHLEIAIKKYESGKYNYKQLSDYVCENLPKKYISIFLQQSINLQK